MIRPQFNRPTTSTVTSNGRRSNERRLCFRAIFSTTEDPDERQSTVFPLSRTAPESTTACLRSSGLKISVMNLLNWNQKVTKWLRKRKSSVIKDSASGEENSERVDDIMELKRFRIRVIDSTEECRRTRSSVILVLCWNISIFSLKKAAHLHHLRSQKGDSGIWKNRPS